MGEAPQVSQIRRQITKISRSRAPVLLLGESGTGKEVIARAIYDANPHGNFVPIDCGSLVGPLMESELFGHTKGAFTGATENKKGLIELADGGTVFFDEIGDLPLLMQVKLLRLLQEREFRAVGSLKQRQVDIRVIAATNKNLSKEVERGNFRGDLFYRLNVVRLHLSPLRERKSDIPLLIQHFLRQLGKENYKLDTAALEAMVEYDWPGNIRELRNAIEQMTTMNTGPVLHSGDLPFIVASQVGEWDFAADEADAELPVFHQPARPSPVPISLMQTEKDAILRALEYTNGNRPKAAKLLGIGRTTLHRKLKEYRIAD